MHRKCVVKHIVHDKADPNDVPIEAIHASNIRLMTNFIRHPSPHLAHAIIRMLEALENHDERFDDAACGNVYQQFIAAWQRILHDFEYERMAPDERTAMH